MIEFILSFVSNSLANILELPPTIKYPGFLILALLGVRGFRAILALRLFRAISSIIMFIVISFILSRFGGAIAQLIENSSQQ